MAVDPKRAAPDAGAPPVGNIPAACPAKKPLPEEADWEAKRPPVAGEAKALEPAADVPNRGAPEETPPEKSAPPEALAGGGTTTGTCGLGLPNMLLPLLLPPPKSMEPDAWPLEPKPNVVGAAAAPPKPKPVDFGALAAAPPPVKAKAEAAIAFFFSSSFFAASASMPGRGISHTLHSTASSGQRSMQESHFQPAFCAAAKAAKEPAPPAAPAVAFWPSSWSYSS